MQPDYKLIVDGVDIRPKINGRLIELTLTDNRGMTSDELTLVIDDSDGKLQFPRLGAIISVAIGFKNNLVPKGTFISDEISHS
jgi:Bacteriophage probable baseplate hub protein